ncbi:MULTISPECIES: GvpL/GvpF family gas vesicle protein [Streptomyces]|uniref:GvpL/GvpF family gas vesicle protein n=1 Tax=Streptomyces TaxID=1883 RepID=UPI001C2E4E7B|nr:MULTISPECIES: GvpL/GvpF family gas vesicle protein [Streptomyces]MBV1948412.1 GvpL/GvpF family gas vesicle protein [Streptomyces sp. BV129]BDH06458.1 gas vesicle protein [Streptomyces seoulensis]
MGVYVYSVTDKQHPLRLDDLRGVGESPGPLRAVTAGSLCAVVSDAPEDLRPKRRDVGAHQEVQERLMADGTVLPLRFGLVAASDDEVRAALEERAEDYADRLRELEGCAEYHLKVSQDEESLLRQILAESPQARQLNDEIRAGSDDPSAPVRLGELVAQEVQARQEALAAGVVEALRPFARDLDSSQPTGSDFVSVSFLVADDQEEAFLTTELSVAHQLGEGFDFRLNGPLPPYSFV